MEPQGIDSNRRMLLALGVSLVLWMVYMTFFAPSPPEPAAVTGADAGVAAVAPAPAQPDAGVTAPAPGGTVEAAPADATPPPPVREVTATTQNTVFGFTTRGAGLTQAELQGQKMREQTQLSIAQGYKRMFGGSVPEAPQMDMGRPAQGHPPPLGVSIEGARPFAGDAAYALQEDTGKGLFVFTGRQGQTEIVKTVQLAHDGFEGAMDVKVRNLGVEALVGSVVVHYGRAVEPGTEEKASFFGGVGNESQAACSVADELHKRVPDDDAAPQVFKGGIEFFGVDQQYFLAALFPLEGAREGECRLIATPSARQVAAAFTLNVPPGGEQVLRFGLFVGPKDGEVLSTVPDRTVALGLVEAGPKAGDWTSGFQGSRYPHLERTIDHGIWAAIVKVLLFFMQWFFRAFGNWGVAIILLTVLVKVILLPLTHKSMVAAENMKKLQPRIEELRKKFADDKNRQNMEMMKLYQEAKVNPLGGCLPLLIQMPVWIALFTALRNSFDIYREPFIAPVWLDLTYKDPTYLLPLLLGITMIVTQKLQPQMMDPVQAKMMTYVMPVFFTAIMLNYPAGLSLYILTNNILSIGQQYALRKYLEKKGVAAPRPAGKPTASRK